MSGQWVRVSRNMQLPRFCRIRIQTLKQATASVLSFIARSSTARRYDTVVLSGGGMKGVAMLGAMECLHQQGILQHARHFIGTSVGAVVATVMAMGEVPQNIFDAHVLPFKYTPDIDITQVERTFGFDSGKNLEKWLASFIPRDMTFASLYQAHRKSVTICVTNLNTQQVEYFSKENRPDMPLRLALRMSCSVPLYFAAVEYEGQLYVDGGVACNFALNHAHDSGSERVLGVHFATPSKPGGHVWSLDSFLGAVLESGIARHHTLRMHNNTTVIPLCIDGTHPLNFKMSKDRMRQLYRSGYQQTSLYFKKND